EGGKLLLDVGEGLRVRVLRNLDNRLLAPAVGRPTLGHCDLRTARARRAGNGARPMRRFIHEGGRAENRRPTGARMTEESLVQGTAIAARDGYALAATVFTPEGPPRGTVLVNSATAVPRRFYAGFAAYLAERGFACLTYDYRGVGGSRP